MVSTQRFAASPRAPLAYLDDPFSLPLPMLERTPVDLTPHIIARETDTAAISTAAATQTDELLPSLPEAPRAVWARGVDSGTNTCGQLVDVRQVSETLADTLTQKCIDAARVELEQQRELQLLQELKEKAQAVAEADKAEDDIVDVESAAAVAREEAKQAARIRKEALRETTVRVRALVLAQRHVRGGLIHGAFHSVLATQMETPEMHAQVRSCVEKAASDGRKKLGMVTGMLRRRRALS